MTSQQPKPSLKHCLIYFYSLERSHHFHFNITTQKLSQNRWKYYFPQGRVGCKSLRLRDISRDNMKKIKQYAGPITKLFFVIKRSTSDIARTERVNSRSDRISVNRLKVLILSDDWINIEFASKKHGMITDKKIM